MQKLNQAQIKTMIGLIANTQPDGLGCDDCLGQISEFADVVLAGNELTEAMKLIERHLEQCPCCQFEYKTLLTALRELEE